jgi:hypothetical protein
VVLECEVNLRWVGSLDFNGDNSITRSRTNSLGYDSVQIPRNGKEFCIYEPHRASIVHEHHDSASGSPPPASAALSTGLGRYEMFYAAPGKHVVHTLNPETSNQLPLTMRAVAYLWPSPPPQHHNGYVYASVHARDINGHERMEDSDSPVDIDAGFEVAPGNASDIEIVNAHPWGSTALLFSDGTSACTAQFIAEYPHANTKGLVHRDFCI